MTSSPPSALTVLLSCGKSRWWNRSVGLPWVQGRTRRRGCCCTSCWRWGSLRNSWRWPLAALPPDSASWLQTERKHVCSVAHVTIIKTTALLPAGLWWYLHLWRPSPGKEWGREGSRGPLHSGRWRGEASGRRTTSSPASGPSPDRPRAAGEPECPSTACQCLQHTGHTGHRRPGQRGVDLWHRTVTQLSQHNDHELRAWRVKRKALWLVNTHLMFSVVRWQHGDFEPPVRETCSRWSAVDWPRLRSARLQHCWVTWPALLGSRDTSGHVVAVALTRSFSPEVIGPWRSYLRGWRRGEMCWSSSFIKRLVWQVF